MGSVVPSNAAPPQQEVTGPQHDAPTDFASSTPSITRRAAAPYRSRTVSVSSAALTAGVAIVGASAGLPATSDATVLIASPTASLTEAESSQQPGAQHALVSLVSVSSVFTAMVHLLIKKC